MPRLSDAYLSVIRALQHVGMAVQCSVEIAWVESSDLKSPGNHAHFSNGALNSGNSADSERSSSSKGSTSPSDMAQRGETAWELIGQADGIQVPGGFGDRGVEGKINAVKYCRNEKKPFLGIFLGTQMAAVEAVRTV